MESDRTSNESSSVYWIILLVSTPGVAFSVYLLNLHTLITIGLYSGNALCNLGEAADCGKVAATEWATIFGIPQASFGLVFYLSLFLLSLLSVNKRFIDERAAGNALLIAGLGAVAYSIFLFIISEFVIKSICVWCLGMYLVNFALAEIALRWNRSESFLVRVKHGLLCWCLLPYHLWQSLKDGTEKLRKSIFFALFAELIVVLITWQAPYSFAAYARLKQQISDLQSKLDIKLDFSDGPMRDYFKGNPDAPIEIVVFSDIECPACRIFHGFLQDLEQEFTGQVRIVYKNFPLDHHCNRTILKPYHLNSCYAAHLACCAGEQDSFWSVIDFLYSLPIFEKHLPEAVVRKEIQKAISELPLDQQALSDCMESKRHLPRIERDIRQGVKLKIRGTPTVFVNGKAAILSKKELRKIFRSILAEASKNSLVKEESRK